MRSIERLNEKPSHGQIQSNIQKRANLYRCVCCWNFGNLKLENFVIKFISRFQIFMQNEPIFIILLTILWHAFPLSHNAGIVINFQFYFDKFLIPAMCIIHRKNQICRIFFHVLYYYWQLIVDSKTIPTWITWMSSAKNFHTYSTNVNIFLTFDCRLNFKMPFGLIYQSAIAFNSLILHHHFF